MPMFVRFVTNLKDTESHQRLGVIRSVDKLAHRIKDDDLRLLDNLIVWFRDNLRVPNRFKGLKRRQAKKKAICWFKDSSIGCIAITRLMAQTLEKNGIATAKIVTRKPGYIVYEDSHQVAAIPFRDTFAG